MGKFKRKNTYKDKRDPSKKQKNGQGEYSTHEFVKENKALETFYKFQLQGEFKTESEFKQFMNILRERLPITFRINNAVPNYKNFLDRIKDKDFIIKTLGAGEVEKTKDTKKDGEDSSDSDLKEEETLKLFPVPWDPNQLIWQMNTFRHNLKKNEALKALHKLIQQASESGMITRQELVSMLPPLLLDIQGSDIIFDMCAAPGSKTSQMLEILYRNEVAGKGLTTGGVMANDVDYQRANMLIHQVQRISTAGMMVVNHAAQYFPILKETEGTKERFFFDKILCDVPCSGDGAIRKIPQKWQKWSCTDGTSLHPLQLQILMRAIQLVKVGGLVLYSTCSINPIEDEAVVTELFRRCAEDDSIELLDVSERLPDLIVRKGLYKWCVCDNKDIKKEESKVAEGEEKPTEPSDLFNIYESADQLPKDYQGLIRPGMFPDTLENMRDKYQIHKTVRLMPHDQNTGGFYLALIRKKKNVIFTNKNKAKKEAQKVEAEEKEVDEDQAIRELDKDVQNIPKEMLQVDDSEEKPKSEKKDEIEEEEKKEEKSEETKTEAQEDASEDGKKKDKKKKQMYVELSSTEWDWINDHYGLNAPFLNLKSLFIQQNEGDKRIVFISPGIRKILDLDKNSVIQKLNMGAKAFSRNRDAFLDNKFPFRICQDAIQSLFPFMTKRKVQCSAADFIFFIQNPSIKYENIPNPELRKQIQDIGHGSFVLYCEKDGVIQDRDIIVCLNHANSVTPMVSKELVSSFKLRYLL